MERILIVDDNPKNIQLLGNILSDNNYEVEYALNGEYALKMVESDDFDLILMDIMMPGLDGFETCIRIKSMESKSKIPLIFLTANVDTESIKRGFQVGGVDYLTKPFNADELLVRINTHISLKKSKDKLNELNELLEQKVMERTAELTISNKNLEKANQELSVLDNSKSEFLRLISHEIRTPLNGILGFSNIIKETVKDEFVSEMIEILDVSCKRLEGFSYLALDISQLNSLGFRALSLKPFDISEVVEEAIAFQKQFIEEKKLSVELYAEKAQANIDIKFFLQCIQIVTSNAVHHSPEHGKISITGKCTNNFYIIHVKDEGKGFPEILLKEGIKAFTSKHVDRNPGLDLYLCKLIAEAHNGTIKLENQSGAMVEICVPILVSMSDKL